MEHMLTFGCYPCEHVRYDSDHAGAPWGNAVTVWAALSATETHWAMPYGRPWPVLAPRVLTYDLATAYHVGVLIWT